MLPSLNNINQSKDGKSKFLKESYGSAENKIHIEDLLESNANRKAANGADNDEIRFDCFPSMNQ